MRRKRNSWSYLTPEEQGLRFIIMGVIALILSIAAIIIGYMFNQSNIEHSQSDEYTETTARVVDFDKDTEVYYTGSGSNRTRHTRTVCEIEYTYTIDGTDITNTTSNCLDDPTVGSSIVIYYENANVNHVLFDYDNTFRLLSYIWLPILSLAMIGFGVYKKFFQY